MNVEPNTSVSERGIPILTYHSQNIRGSGYALNDHVALQQDLQAVHQAGYRVAPLDWLADWLEGTRDDADVDRAIILTFDDGCDFDVRDLEYPGHGPQRSFEGIMRDLLHQSATPALHATAFVIACPEARRTIDAGSLFGKGWMSDDWWQATDAGGLIAIENHGWDHNHPDLAGEQRGAFHTVDTNEQCLQQVVRAAAAIEQITQRRPRYFAYPFGESSDYIREQFFPQYPEVHGCRAALGTDPGPVTRSSDRWNLPRFVCGRDWQSPQELLDLIQP
jgi:peptidoglycan/xylan/chitin deacetylase (PgdA/CDA1 family)